MRVIFTVRDYVAPERERTAVHCIDNIDFEVADKVNPPAEKDPATSGLSDGGTVSAAGVAGHPVTPHPFKVRLSQILGGEHPYLREDKREYFDTIDDSSRVEGGVYYEPDELNRIVGRKGALSTMHGADVSEIKNDIWLAQGLAVRMRDDGKSPKQIFDETGWQLGADGKRRFEIDDPVLKDTAFDALKRDRQKWEAKEEEFFESKETDSLSVDEQKYQSENYSGKSVDFFVLEQEFCLLTRRNDRFAYCRS